MSRVSVRRAIAPVVIACVSACVVPGAVAGPSQAQAAVAEGVFAVVDGEAISQNEFQSFLLQFARSKFFHKVPEERLAALREEAAEALIVQRLLAHEAERRGLPGDPETVEQRLHEYEARYKDSNTWPQMKREWPALRGRLLEASKVETLVREIRAVEPPSDDELERYYAQQGELFTQPAAARLSVILIAVDPSAGPDEWRLARGRADDLVRQLAAGADFAALARQHSTHESAPNGGDVGWVHDGMLSQPAQQAVDALELDTVSPPVRVLEGYTVFRVHQRRPAAVSPLPEIRDRVRALYERERSQQQWDAFLAGLKAQAEIVMREPPPPRTSE